MNVDAYSEVNQFLHELNFILSVLHTHTFQLQFLPYWFKQENRCRVSPLCPCSLWTKENYINISDILLKGTDLWVFSIMNRISLIWLFDSNWFWCLKQIRLVFHSNHLNQPRLDCHRPAKSTLCREKASTVHHTRARPHTECQMTLSL